MKSAGSMPGAGQRPQAAPPWRAVVPMLVLAAAVLAPSSAQAGNSCEDKPLTPQAITQGMALAGRVRDALDGSGASVAFIARAGQDLSRYGLRYSHMALVWHDEARSRWLVVHELNQCGTAESALFNEGLGNFFLDDMFRYESQIIIPGPAVQARLAQLLASATPRRLHEAHYNMLSYAFSTRYQNSNQWVLESYASAMAGPGQVETRGEAQAWLKREGFRPITVEIPALTRLGARMFRANAAFDDHPFERRMAGQIDTVTVDSVARFIKERDAEARDIIVR